MLGNNAHGGGFRTLTPMSDAEELRETLVAIQRENSILRTETAHSKLLLKTLNTLLDINTREDPFTRIFPALLSTFDAAHVIVLTQRSEEDEELECAASSHPALIGTRWPSNRTLSKVLGGRIITTIAGSSQNIWPEAVPYFFSSEQPLLYLPLAVREKRGLLMLLRDACQPGFDRTHVDLARKFSVLASHAFAARYANQAEAESHRLKQLTRQLRSSQEALAHRANHDQLTGLPNRTYIEELVNQALANRSKDDKLAIAFIDLDNFKRINDFYGHSVGDALLKAITGRIRKNIRKTDLLGRISGDEFVIALDPLERRAEMSALVSRIRQELQTPFEIEGFRIQCGGSVGVAFFPNHGHDYNTLRRNADTAMYEAKLSNKGGIAYFSKALGRRMVKQMHLEHRLRQALQQQEFKCALQAKVNIFTRSIMGFEALVRWVDKKGIVHVPGHFLKTANELGLLDSIAESMFDELMSNMPALDQAFGNNIKYSINLSASQASRTGFMRSFAQRIAASGRAHNFMLELTEESIITAGVFQTQILPMLRELGIGISIDDFGTGYSSLSTLADITADEIKIDRSFVSSIHERSRSQSILRAIESICSALDVAVIAEGIETEEENIYLQKNSGINIAQGYLFHRPAFIAEVIRELAPPYHEAMADAASCQLSGLSNRMVSSSELSSIARTSWLAPGSR